ncbi:MAG TPA: hypothetical protein VGL57_09215 [Solirubrobacteraceae bacterium]|jgi:hypothetical protein
MARTHYAGAAGRLRARMSGGLRFKACGGLFWVSGRLRLRLGALIAGVSRFLVAWPLLFGMARILPFMAFMSLLF